MLGEEGLNTKALCTGAGTGGPLRENERFLFPWTLVQQNVKGQLAQEAEVLYSSA